MWTYLSFYFFHSLSTQSFFWLTAWLKNRSGHWTKFANDFCKTNTHVFCAFFSLIFVSRSFALYVGSIFLSLYTMSSLILVSILLFYTHVFQYPCLYSFVLYPCLSLSLSVFFRSIPMSFTIFVSILLFYTYVMYPCLPLSLSLSFCSS